MTSIPFSRPFLTGHEFDYVRQAIERMHISGDGEFTRRCQALLEQRIGVPRAFLTTSCTHALEMSAILLDIKPGDEVILPSFMKYAINFHPALLPRNRGRYLHYILINDEKHSGVTAHFIDEGIDSGSIIKQASFEVSPFDTVKGLMRKSSELEIHLVREVLDMIDTGNVPSTPQDESQATIFTEKRTPADSEIDANLSLKEAFLKIRACDPELYPAFFYIDGQKVFLKAFRQQKPDGEEDMI